ncbi:hypothetical protein J6590_013183 [Homalodisca vitripennis]|nr:hypothetical protein J6590_013183 [Homalodisca vitripennis]
MLKNHLLERLVPVYRAATKEELASCPGDWRYGSYFETLLTECRKFLPWALNKLKNSMLSSLDGHERDLHHVVEHFVSRRVLTVGRPRARPARIVALNLGSQHSRSTVLHCYYFKYEINSLTSRPFKYCIPAGNVART